MFPLYTPKSFLPTFYLIIPSEIVHLYGGYTLRFHDHIWRLHVCISDSRGDQLYWLYC